MRAIWKGTVLAESDDTVVVEGNHYFPADALIKSHFRANDHQSICPWKGTASYYDLEVDGKRNANAAWYYSDPKPPAAKIKGYIAFWKGVRVVE
jgi:uncharacterized protein (DUF427 family)